MTDLKPRGQQGFTRGQSESASDAPGRRWNNTIRAPGQMSQTLASAARDQRCGKECR